MSKNEEKKVRQVASCVRTLLASKGKNIKVKDVFEMIKNEDLDDPIALSQKVESEYQEPQAVQRAKKESAATKRREKIASFVVENWNQIKDNDPVRDGLLHLYAMGRVAKEQRKRLQEDLIARCTGTNETTQEDNNPGAELLNNSPNL